jgi:hypothetical protein
MVTSTLGLAFEHTLTAPLQQILDADFDSIQRIEALPPGVQKLLPSGMANPNEGFNAMDVMDGKPSRRLILAGHYSKCDFVCYEHGGYGYHLHLLIFTNGNEGTQRIFEGSIFKDAKDAATMADVKRLIQSGEVHDETKQYEKHPEF